MLIINSQDKSEFIGKSIDEFLKFSNLNKSAIAAELNGEIVVKAEFDKILKDGDKLEIVCFVPGG